MENIQSILEQKFTTRLKINEPMSEHISFKVGGPAELYLDIDKIDDLVEVIRLAKQHTIPYLVFGSGTHMLVSENGIKGLVIKNNCRKFEIMRVSGKIKNQKLDVDRAFVFAEAGVILNQLVRFTIEEGYAGLEYQLGLPGTVGGAVCMNSYFEPQNSFVGDYVYMAKILTKSGEIIDVDSAYFAFDKDKTLLQKNGDVLLSVIFSLLPADKKVLWEHGNNALEHRTSGMPQGQANGMTFRNMFVTQALKSATQYKNYSAAALLEKSGLLGRQVGDAVISEKQPNFIINKGKATTADVVQLLRLTKDQLYEKFGILLHVHDKIMG